MQLPISISIFKLYSLNKNTVQNTILDDHMSELLDTVLRIAVFHCYSAYLEKYDMKNEARLCSASRIGLVRMGFLNKMVANTRVYFISK